MTDRISSILAASFLMVACGGEDPGNTPTATPEPQLEDLRRSFPAPPEGALVLLTPDMIIPAGQDKMMCYFQTFQQDDVGIIATTSYQSEFGHHSVLMVSNADASEYPDNQMFDCTGKNSLPMTQIEPVIVGGEILDDSEGQINEFRLPTELGTMAALLRNGKRIVVQSHYVNTKTHDILVHDAVYLETVPESDVDIWAGPFVQNNDVFSIPANASSYSASSEYTFEDELNVLYVTGHMHEWGRRYDVELTRNGQMESIYSVPEWDPYYRDRPVYVDFELGTFKFMPGDTIKSTCTWFNDRDIALEFPDEMCSTVTMVYPTKVPIIVGPDE